jgi:WD40 repeat protein
LGEPSYVVSPRRWQLAPTRTASDWLASTELDVLSEELAPPRSLNAAADRDLETIPLKCLRKDPGQPLGGDTDGVGNICFSPDARLLAAYLPGEVRLWDDDTGQCLRTLTPRAGLSCINFSPDGRFLVVGSFWEVLVGCRAGKVPKAPSSHPSPCFVRQLAGRNCLPGWRDQQ